MQGLLMKTQNSELSGWCVGPVDFVQSYGMKYDSENLFPGVTLGFFPQKTSAKSVTNTERLQDIMAMEKRYQGKWT
jgi:hypothetical protein